jgi:hypothetical protein
MNVRNRERGVKIDRDNKSRTQVLTLEANTIIIHAYFYFGITGGFAEVSLKNRTERMIMHSPRGLK